MKMKQLELTRVNNRCPKNTIQKKTEIKKCNSNFYNAKTGKTNT